MTSPHVPEARMTAVAKESAEILSEAVGLGTMLLLDIWTGGLQANEADRAVQLRGVIERLGPAFVKVAQALSTRSDLLSPEYFLQIQKLQDRVPPFPCAQAKAAMKAAFKRPVEEVFSVLSEKPVAAASLGQVYRATLKPEMGGGEVAVKVLRPGVLEQVDLCGKPHINSMPIQVCPAYILLSIQRLSLISNL
jgi:aarF domain-containing kinase